MAGDLKERRVAAPLGEFVKKALARAEALAKSLRIVEPIDADHQFSATKAIGQTASLAKIGQLHGLCAYLVDVHANRINAGL